MPKLVCHISTTGMLSDSLLQFPKDFPSGCYQSVAAAGVIHWFSNDFACFCEEWACNHTTHLVIEFENAVDPLLAQCMISAPRPITERRCPPYTVLSPCLSEPSDTCSDVSASTCQELIELHEVGIPVAWPHTMRAPLKRLRRKTLSCTEANHCDASGSGDPVHADTVVNSSENILSTANVPDNSALADVQELHNTGVSVVWPSDAPIKLQRLRHKNEVSFPMSPN